MDVVLPTQNAYTPKNCLLEMIKVKKAATVKKFTKRKMNVAVFSNTNDA